MCPSIEWDSVQRSQPSILPLAADYGIASPKLSFFL